MCAWDTLLTLCLLQEPSLLEILDEWEIVIAPIIFTLFAVFTRLYKIGLSDIVTWDVSQASPCLPLSFANLDHRKLSSSPITLFPISNVPLT